MDATFWALVSLIIFLVLLAYLKVPASIGRSLDERAANIAKELEEARRLREEAQALLAEYHRKRKEAEEEASNIIAAATREAKAFVEEAKQKTEEYVARRNKLAEQKIASAETEAINEVRSLAVDLAVAAASKVVADKVDAKTEGALFKTSLEEVKARLN